jgi:hypothetical protein
VSETVRRVREEFPKIKDPLQTALAEVDKVTKLLADRGLESGAGCPADGSRPADEPLVARDTYGSRFLLTAPFSYDGGAPDHWYAWGIDVCRIDVVVGAGAFASAEDALREWRDAVGPMASAAALSPCAAGMTARLLAPSLQTGVLADLLQGHEPRELIREYYRQRRRAHDLAVSADADAGSSPFDAGQAHDAFLDWYATRHDDVPAATTEAAGTILAEWDHMRIWTSIRSTPARRIVSRWRRTRSAKALSPTTPTWRSALLPEWTQWCIEKSELGGAAADRSREAACSAASTLVEDEDDRPAAADDEAPFRRQE